METETLSGRITNRNWRETGRVVLIAIAGVVLYRMGIVDAVGLEGYGDLAVAITSALAVFGHEVVRKDR